MPGLRLTRRARPPAQLLRLLLSAAAAGVGFLLLAALAHALQHPGEPRRTLPGLAWCAVPLTATVVLAAAVWRGEAAGRHPGRGRETNWLPVAVLRRYAAVATAVATLLGVLLALLVFLHLRGDLTGLPFDGLAAGPLAAAEPLPLAAALTLLSLVPLAAVPAAVVAVRPRAASDGPPATGSARSAGRLAPAARAAGTPAPAPEARPASGALAWAAAVGRRRAAARGGRAPDTPPARLPWGGALLAGGLAVSAHAGWRAGSGAGGAAAFPPAGALSWGPVAGGALVAAGLVVVMPGLLVALGRALRSGEPGAVRLLAGRGVERYARVVGHPLGALAAAVAVAWAVWLLNGPGFLGPFGTLGAAVVLLATAASVAAAAAGARRERLAARAALAWLGAARSLGGRAAALGATTVLAAVAPLVAVVAWLLALPLR